MSWNAIPAAVSGSVIASAYGNTYYKGNLDYLKSVVDGTLAGQIPPGALSSSTFAGVVATHANGVVPTATAAVGGAISSNKSGGGAEVNFYNAFNGVFAGFDFWGWNGSAYVQLARAARPFTRAYTR
jgi:hypothetical protein